MIRFASDVKSTSSLWNVPGGTEFEYLKKYHHHSLPKVNANLCHIRREEVQFDKLNTDLGAWRQL